MGPGIRLTHDNVRDLAGLGALTVNLSTTDPAGNLQRFLAWLRHTTRAEVAEVFLAEPHSRDLVLADFQGPFKSTFAQIDRFRIGEGFPGIVAQSGAPIVTTDLVTDRRYLRSAVMERGFQNYVCVPLRGFNGVLGTLHAASRRPGLDVQRARRILEWASVPLATLVDSTILRAQLATVSREGGVTPAADGIDSTGRLRGILRAFMSIGGATAGTLTLSDRDGGRSVRQIAEGPIEGVVCPGPFQEPSGACPSLEQGRGVAIGRDRQRRPALCRHADVRHGMVHCLPLISGGERLGLVQLWYRGDAPPLSGSNLPILLHMATQAAQTIRAEWDNLRSGPHRQEARDAGLEGLEKPPATDHPTRGSPILGRRDNRGLLEIRCLGTFSARFAGNAVTPKSIQRRGALTVLKLLLLRPGRPIPRDVLVDSLWPDADPAIGANHLHVLLHALRRAIEPPENGRQWLYIRNDGDRYYFNTEAPYWLDTEAFAEKVRDGRVAEAQGRTAAAMSSYEAAVALYRGDYLEDEPYAEWAWQERETLRERCVATLGRLAEWSREFGAVERSVELYRRALRLDPLREETLRSLMDALSRTGKRSEALREYGRFCEVLRRELVSDPTVETQSLYTRIREAGGAQRP